MILQISNGRVEFASDVILQHVDFIIKNKNEKIAIVGRNGCGKTTLLKLISGELDMAQDESDAPSTIAKTGNPSIGYLKQITFEDENLTLDEEIRKVFKRVLSMKARLEELVGLLEEDREDHEKLIQEYTSLQEEFQDIGGYYYEKEYDVMMKSFGFSMEDKKKKLSEFSGGQRTKLAFIKLLLSKPDILLLDEPTNHLDVNAIEWLEGYLKGYTRAVVIVSHDRMFLDKIVDTVYEIEHHTTKRYPGNYTEFVERKKQNYEKQMKDHLAQQKEIERLNAIVERFKGKPTKVSMARSKLKAIEHMDIIEAPDRYDNKTFHASFEPDYETGKDVLSVRNLQIGYSEDKPLCTVSFEVKKGQRLGIVGGNGLGKSTLLKTITGIIDPLSGEYSYGVNVQIGYFDQQMAQYTSDKTVIDEFWDEYPTLTETEVRNCLGAFLFTQDDVFKTVKMLSGGERVRLALCKIFKDKPNVLILDEPTNHMDIVGKETLESMLCDYHGTVIFVSHDRYFVNKVSDTILAIEPGEAKLYPFGYEDYKEKMEMRRLAEQADDNLIAGGTKKNTGSLDGNTISGTETAEKQQVTSAKASYATGKEIARTKKNIEKIEAEIKNNETKTEELKEMLADPALSSDYIKLQEIQNEIDALEEELLNKMAQWEELLETLSNLQGEQ